MSVRRTLGLATIIGWSRPLDEVLDVAAAAALDGVEITGRSPHLSSDASPQAVSAVRRATETRDLEVLAFGSYVGFQDAFDRSDADTAIAVTHDLGAPRIRVWAGSPTGELDSDGFDALVSLLQYSCDEAEAYDIEVVVERHCRSFADTVPNVRRLLSAIDRTNVSLNYQPLDHLPANAAATVPGDAKELAPLATYAHLKNYEVRDSRILELGAALGAGALDYHAILKASLGAGFDGPLVLEFTSKDENIPFENRVHQDLDFLRKLL